MSAVERVARAAFVLDSNIFIEAKKRYYAFDLCPGFWSALERHCADGRLVSIDRVKTELSRVDDELKRWAFSALPTHGFSATTIQPVIEAYGQVVAWAMAQAQFTPAAKAEFADDHNADAWVVAYAKVSGGTVVTHEKHNPHVRIRVPLPNACHALGVPVADTFEMLRALSVQFSWQQP